MKVIIAGSRGITSYEDVEAAMLEAQFCAGTCPEEDGWHEVTEIVSGCARGVDQLGEIWADRHNVFVKRFPADWSNLDVPGAVIRSRAGGKRYNARAGADRNEQMARYADALVAVWDGKTPGTGNMISLAKQYGRVVHIKLVTSKADIMKAFEEE